MGSATSTIMPREQTAYFAKMPFGTRAGELVPADVNGRHVKVRVPMGVTPGALFKFTEADIVESMTPVPQYGHPAPYGVAPSPYGVAPSPYGVAPSPYGHPSHFVQPAGVSPYGVAPAGGPLSQFQVQTPGQPAGGVDINRMFATNETPTAPTYQPGMYSQPPVMVIPSAPIEFAAVVQPSAPMIAAAPIVGSSSKSPSAPPPQFSTGPSYSGNPQFGSAPAQPQFSSASSSMYSGAPTYSAQSTIPIAVATPVDSNHTGYGGPAFQKNY